MPQNHKFEATEVENFILATFGSRHGQKALDWLKYRANKINISPHDPNPNAAVYKAAQLAMIHEIERVLERANKGIENE